MHWSNVATFRRLTNMAAVVGSHIRCVDIATRLTITSLRKVCGRVWHQMIYLYGLQQSFAAVAVETPIENPFAHSK